MIVLLKNAAQEQVCFMHAVKRAMGSEPISMECYDDSDCGETGCWWAYDCSDCIREDAEK